MSKCICALCNGTGEVDSGAPDPQGHFIQIACECQNENVDEGFFCQKCGTVYTPEIMACRTCQPKAYAKLLEGKHD